MYPNLSSLLNFHWSDRAACNELRMSQCLLPVVFAVAHVAAHLTTRRTTGR